MRPPERQQGRRSSICWCCHLWSGTRNGADTSCGNPFVTDIVPRICSLAMDRWMMINRWHVSVPQSAFRHNCWTAHWFRCCRGSRFSNTWWRGEGEHSSILAHGGRSGKHKNRSKARQESLRKYFAISFPLRSYWGQQRVSKLKFSHIPHLSVNMSLSQKLCRQEAAEKNVQ